MGQISFFLLWATAILLTVRRGLNISKAIRQGKPVHIKPSWRRFRTMLRIAMGQQKMVKRPIAGFLHLIVYLGFLVINIEIIEFTADGLLGTHRVLAPYLKDLYPTLMNIFEGMAVAVVIACVIFLVRRNGLRLSRFHGLDMTSWPRLDANLILIMEILLMGAILTMNATDQILQTRHEPQYIETGTLYISSLFIPLFNHQSTTTLIFLERAAWWLHMLGIYAFGIYVTYSKHLHILLAFPTAYFAREDFYGKLSAMPEVTKEVKSMLGMELSQTSPAEEVGRFGAKDVQDLPWTSLLGAYACTECGRCTSECPAHLTGKKLSPRRIMMATRDRLQTIERKQHNKSSDKESTLLYDYISLEEIHACTSCNACAEACPILINPLDIIIELRRFVVMEESKSPASWNTMFQNIETNFAPWKFPAADRFNWSQPL